MAKSKNKGKLRNRSRWNYMGSNVADDDKWKLAGQNPAKNAKFPTIYSIWSYTTSAAKSLVNKFIKKVNGFMKQIKAKENFDWVINKMKTFAKSKAGKNALVTLASSIPLPGGFTTGDFVFAAKLLKPQFWKDEYWLFNWLIRGKFVKAFRKGDVATLQRASTACVDLNGVVAFFAKIGVVIGDPSIKTGSTVVLYSTKVVGPICGNLVTIYLLSKKVASILKLAKSIGWKKAF